MSRLTKSPLEALLATLDDDNALVKASTLKTVVKAMMRQVPIPGKGMKAIEMPDGIVLEADFQSFVNFPFRTHIENGLVKVSPGFWDFAGQPTFPGWGDGAIFGFGVDPSLISVGSAQRWRFYLRADHDVNGVLSQVPIGLQSATQLTNTNTQTYLLIAVGDKDGSFDQVLQVAGGSIITGLSPFLNNSGEVTSIGRSHYSY